jgi:SAM-dependent methyltransferase
VALCRVQPRTQWVKASSHCPSLANPDFALTFLGNPTLPLSDFESFKEKAFANMWLKFGPMCADDIHDALPPLLAASKGLILDVGPGSGEQVKRFTHPENIKAIYGVEPGVSLHDKLKEKAKMAGLDGKYHVLSATADLDAVIPELIKAGVIKEGKTSSKDLQIFDEIVCLRVLCGVPNQAASVADLYSLLKPGGRFVVFEHVLNTLHTPARLAQQLYMLLGWKQLMGGCCLTRDTMETFKQVANARDGGFAKVEIQHADPMSPVIHVVGVLTKKS